MATRLERWAVHLAPPSFGRGASMFRLLERERHVLVPSRAAYEPPTDVYDTEEEVIVRLEIAGLNPSRGRTTIELTDDLLIVAGEREDPAGNASRRYQQMEIETGRFERAVRLPAPVDATAAVATYDDGFLVIRLPKVKPTHTAVCLVRVE